jgi:hypothetical protein
MPPKVFRNARHSDLRLLYQAQRSVRPKIRTIISRERPNK